MIESRGPEPDSAHKGVPATRGERDGTLALSRRLLLIDLVAIIASVTVAQVLVFGFFDNPSAKFEERRISYAAIGAALTIGWWLFLQIHQSRSPRVLGHGPEEYRRIMIATLRAFAALAIGVLAFKVDISRLYLGILLSVGLVALLLGRKLARVRLHRARSQGQNLSEVLVVGGRASASHLASWFARHPAGGFTVGAVWVPDSEIAEGFRDTILGTVPVFSSQVPFATAVARSGVGSVIVTDTERLGNDQVREIIWSLEGTGVDLFLSPNLHGVDSSRLHLHDIFSMPMLEVTEPTYAGASGWGKSSFDRIGAALILIAATPVLAITALAVKLSSPGPVFYLQERIGLGGRPFHMIKFRSMRQGSDSQLEALLAARGKSLAELPKLDDDPRVTSVGAFIRRYSIDELPQLFNVLRGDMSLVGPRPQRHFEVERYDHVATRRLTVRPGMTGLWQVSGRSNLSFEEAIQLDVRYVENWSIPADLMILWKTVRAVTRSDGAV